MWRQYCLRLFKDLFLLVNDLFLKWFHNEKSTANRSRTLISDAALITVLHFYDSLTAPRAANLKRKFVAKMKSCKVAWDSNESLLIQTLQCTILRVDLSCSHDVALPLSCSQVSLLMQCRWESYSNKSWNKKRVSDKNATGFRLMGFEIAAGLEVKACIGVDARVRRSEIVTVFYEIVCLTLSLWSSVDRELFSNKAYLMWSCVELALSIQFETFWLWANLKKNWKSENKEWCEALREL